MNKKSIIAIVVVAIVVLAIIAAIVGVLVWYFLRRSAKECFVVDSSFAGIGKKSGDPITAAEAIAAAKKNGWSIASMAQLWEAHAAGASWCQWGLTQLDEKTGVIQYLAFPQDGVFTGVLTLACGFAGVVNVTTPAVYASVASPIAFTAYGKKPPAGTVGIGSWNSTLWSRHSAKK
jgi:hypothetical protein